MRSVSLLSLVLALSGCGVMFRVQAPATVAHVAVADEGKVDAEAEVAVAPSPFGDPVEGEVVAELDVRATVSVEGSAGADVVATGFAFDGEAGSTGATVGEGGFGMDVGVEGVATGRVSVATSGGHDETSTVGVSGGHDATAGVSGGNASGGGHTSAGGAEVFAEPGYAGTPRDGVVVEADAVGEVDGRVVLEPGVRAAGGLDLEVDVALRGDPGAAPEALGGGAGVRAAPPVGGGRSATRPSLGALTTETGVNVDGFRTRLGDLGPLAPLALDAEARAGVSLDTDGRVDVRAELAHAQLPRAGGETDLVVRVRGGEPAASARARVRVHLVIDRSSSMRASWADLLAAASALVDQLAPTDELHVVAYDANATTVVPLGAVGDGRRAKRAITALSVGGGTNIEVGMRAAYDAVLRAPGDVAPLVVLLSDGVPNGGAFTADDLAPMAANASARVGCTTTVVGLGDEFDAEVLQAIAAAGHGGYHVAASIGDLSAVLREEVRAQVRVAARALDLGVALPDGVELLGAPEGVVRVGAGVRLQMPQLREGEERRVVLRVRVQGGADTVAQVSVRYRSSGGGEVSASKDVGVRFGARAMASGGAAAFAVADAALGEALDVAAMHLRDGRVADAERTLRAHATAYARAPQVELRHRSDVVVRFGTALGVLGADASWGARREVALEMGGLAMRLRR
ncbi:MAG: VWA domain-containing protein [Polyangiales bacterium]